MQTIQATVLQKNAANAFNCGPCGEYGKVMPIPCGTASILGGEYWAVPIKRPYFQGWKFVISSTSPALGALQCFKVTNSITSDWYMVLGTVADYSEACNACCDTSPVPTLVVSDLIDQPSCQDTCTTDGTNYDAFFAVGTPLGAGVYVARVEVDGALVWQQTFGTGSNSIANLVIALNANAASAGTWSNPDEQSIRLRTASAKEICFVACIKTA